MPQSRHACSFCGGSLGSNSVVPGWTAGRSIAIAPAENRLWAICPRCREWNMAPLDERETHEAIAQLGERLTFTPPAPGSAIALAAAGDVEVVRVGSASGLDYACWRYGRRLSWRRHLFIAGAVLIGLVAAQTSTFPAWIALLGAIVVVNIVRDRRRIVALLPEAPPVRAGDAQTASIVAEPGGWALRVDAGGDELTLRGSVALETLRLIMPGINSAGASDAQIARAVQLIGELQGPQHVLPYVIREIEAVDPKYRLILSLPAHARLALEMSLNETREQRMAAGDAAFLPRALDRARDIARIADTL